MANIDTKKVLDTVKEKSVAAGHFVKEKSVVAGRYVAEKSAVAGSYVKEKAPIVGHAVKEKSAVAGHFIKEKSVVAAAATTRAAKNLVWEVKAAPDRTFEFTREDIEQNKLVSMLSYVTFLVLIPLLLPRITKKNSPFMSFHAKQGLILFLIELITLGVLNLLSQIWLIGYLFMAVMVLVSAFYLFISVKSIWDVLNGKAKKLPYIEKLEKFGIRL